MSRQTRSHSTLLNLSRNLLGIGFCLGICTIAQAAGYPGELDTQTLNPIAQYMNARRTSPAANNPDSVLPA